jgi:hypothetical protein
MGEFLPVVDCCTRECVGSRISVRRGRARDAQEAGIYLFVWTLEQYLLEQRSIGMSQKRLDIKTLEECIWQHSFKT